MARGLNKVMLIGHLGKIPEIRYGSSGTAVASISLATAGATKDKATGEWIETTEWHRVVLIGKLAEVAGEYLQKGSKVYLEGRLQTRKWQDQNGQDRYITEIIASEMQMLSSKNGEPGQGQSQPAGRTADAKANKPASQPRPANGADSPPPWDDEIPF